MKIDCLNNGDSFLLTNKNGKMMKISADEFWEICRYGAHLGVAEEVNNCFVDGELKNE